MIRLYEYLIILRKTDIDRAVDKRSVRKEAKKLVYKGEVGSAIFPEEDGL